ncbi:peptidase S8/S53 domain-containing protein [Mycena albidolilacea]|uniref:tripeptidyl-peptidase II n=1 Tax=Mycena albidolilacea TaxID=1033008 RepID=A0AAD7A848_9AGAR|nr:peptidase S8/S53 domain-containing protein [Mycena albidolilacea]
MTIALAQNNLDHGHDRLMEISHPDSPKSGQHLTPAEIVEIFAPPAKIIAVVLEWLHSSGVSPEHITILNDKTRMKNNSFASEAEELLRTQYHIYEHWDTGRVNVACEEYHLPAHIHPHIDFVMPGIALTGSGRARSGKATPSRLDRRGVKLFPGPIQIITNLTHAITNIIAAPLKVCDKYVTPTSIKMLYNIPDNVLANGNLPEVNANNSLVLFEFGDFFSEASLEQFFLTFCNRPFQNPSIPVTTKPEFKSIDGAYIPKINCPSSGTESALDLQVSYPIVYPQEVIIYQSDDNAYTQGLDTGSWSTYGFLNEVLDVIDAEYYNSTGTLEEDKKNDPQYPHIPGPGHFLYDGMIYYSNHTDAGTIKRPSVLSISYGEEEDITHLPESYQRHQCDEFMKLGMLGTSVIVTSGDSGVAARGGCLDNGRVFSPDYPANCPYVTSVGATTLASKALDSEVAVKRFGSGRGFSNIYPILEYQAAAVASYLTNHKPSYPSYDDPKNRTSSTGIFHENGRGYPDVSALGDNIVIFADGTPQTVGGTSASTPVFAAILIRINEERLRVGNRTVGFVNPILYKNPSAFRDITEGTNPGCGTEGFNATKGWDPITGLGSPDYEKLLKVFMALP